jgi:hypothetical protein
MKSNGSQNPVTGKYSKPDKSNPHSLLLKDSLKYIHKKVKLAHYTPWKRLEGEEV